SASCGPARARPTPRWRRCTTTCGHGCAPWAGPRRGRASSRMSRCCGMWMPMPPRPRRRRPWRGATAITRWCSRSRGSDGPATGYWRARPRRRPRHGTIRPSHHPGRDDMLILLDQDGVLADFEHAFIDAWRKRHPDIEPVAFEDRKSFHIREDYAPELRGLAEAIYTAPGFIR